MDTLVKKYERLATLCGVAIVVLIGGMLYSCQYLEREDTVVAAFVVVCISTMLTLVLSWMRSEYKDAAKNIYNFKGRL